VQVGKSAILAFLVYTLPWAKEGSP